MCWERWKGKGVAVPAVPGADERAPFSRLPPPVTEASKCPMPMAEKAPGAMANCPGWMKRGCPAPRGLKNCCPWRPESARLCRCPALRCGGLSVCTISGAKASLPSPLPSMSFLPGSGSFLRPSTLSFSRPRVPNRLSPGHSRGDAPSLTFSGLCLSLLRSCGHRGLPRGVASSPVGLATAAGRSSGAFSTSVSLSAPGFSSASGWRGKGSEQKHPGEARSVSLVRALALGRDCGGKAPIVIKGRNSFQGQKWALVPRSLWGKGINNSRSVALPNRKNMFDGGPKSITASLSLAANSKRAADQGMKRVDSTGGNGPIYI